MSNSHNGTDFQVRVTPIDFSSGQLNGQLSYWISNDDTPANTNPRQQLILMNPQDPAKIIEESTPVVTPRSYIVFQNTDLEKDAGQLTIPYFDAQVLTTIPPTWISGVNLHYKTSPGSGGFVAFQMQHYNVTPHFAVV